MTVGAKQTDIGIAVSEKEFITIPVNAVCQRNPGTKTLGWVSTERGIVHMNTTVLVRSIIRKPQCRPGAFLRHRQACDSRTHILIDHDGPLH